MKTATVLRIVWFVGTVVYLASFLQRLNGAYGFNPHAEDAIAILLIAGVGYLAWREPDAPLLAAGAKLDVHAAGNGARGQDAGHGRMAAGHLDDAIPAGGDGDAAGGGGDRRVDAGREERH